MKIVVGLGNPGRTYALTRHNVGFMVADEFSASHHMSFSRQKFKAEIASGSVAGEQVILAKPQTFMNLSGDAVGPLVRFYDIPLSDLLVIYDDVDIPFGRMRLRPSGTSGGHKGMKSIIASLGTDEFPRLRIGIGRETVPVELADYVLSEFSPEEKAELAEIRGKACRAVEAVIINSLEMAMNQFNS